MADHEMLNLDEMGTLKDSMELLGEELMNGHRINPNLYVEYDVKRGLRDSAGKGVLTGLTEISDVNGYNRSTADRFRLMDVYTIRESMYRISSVV